MDGAAIDRITRVVLDAIAGGASAGPAAVTLLLHQYVATGRTDVRDALGPALAQAIDRCEHGEAEALKGPAALHDDRRDQRADWLMVFVDAAAIADDDRVGAAASSLLDALRSAWPSSGRVDLAMRSVDACLRAAHHDGNAMRIGAAIDELERIVSNVYEPGEGFTALVQPHAHEAGDLRDHLAAASALLTAYQVTARLPYSMLAEELMQFARRSWWDEHCGAFVRGRPANQEADRFVGNAEAARVLCRLAVLHQDSEYRALAVIAHASDYDADARRTLEWLAALWSDRPLDAAASYGLAVAEWLAARVG